MTGHLLKLYDVSVELKKLSESINRTNRDEALPKVNELINERENLIKDIKGPYTDEEKLIGQKIVKINEEIQKSMEILLTNVKKDIVQLKKNKSSNLSYINPYGETETTDGVYLDSKQ